MTNRKDLSFDMEKQRDKKSKSLGWSMGNVIYDTLYFMVFFSLLLQSFVIVLRQNLSRSQLVKYLMSF